MGNFIEMLWHEEYKPSEKNISHKKEIQEAELLLAQREELLLSHLKGEDAILYEEISELQLEMLDMKLLDAYTKGIKMMCEFMKDMLSDN